MKRRRIRERARAYLTMVRVAANAKINLTLDILGRRTDGYHEVSMVMQSVGLSDAVCLSRRPRGIALRLDTPELPADETNLAWKAARLFLDERRIQDGVSIEIEKRIPVAAGLAGGSADAAGVLIGLNRLFGTALSAEALCALGARIGSDVPFCILGGTMLATGRGETLRRLPPMPSATVVLAKPPVGVSTAWAYRMYDRAGAARRPDTEAMLAALASGRVGGVAASLCNVLEAVTAEAHPVIGAYKRVLEANGALAGLMSGSGPTVFALAREESEAFRAADAVSRADPDAAVFVVPLAGPNEI